MGNKKDAMKKKGVGPREVVERASDGFPQEVVADARFSRIHNDPRFQRLPKNKSKVAIDSRFAHMFHDKAFADKESDKRGGSKKSNKQEELLRRYYKYDEDEDEAELATQGDDVPVRDQSAKQKVKSKDSGKKKIVQPESESEGQVGGDAGIGTLSVERIGTGKKIGRNGQSGVKKPFVKQVQKCKDLVKAKKKKKNVQPESESDGVVDEESEEESEAELPLKAKAGKEVATLFNSSDESDSESDSEEEDGSERDDGGSMDEEGSSSSSSSSSESESEDEEGTKDEEKVPTTNQETKRLALMNMDWGHIRAVDLLVVLRSFQPKGGSVESLTIYPSEFGVEQMAKEAVQGPQSIYSRDEDDSEDEADPEKLREYEKAKLRYYYAVAVCDSAETAACIYNSCDGLEYEKTSNTLDLRFIPDDMQFAREPKDSASDIPGDYKPVEFETKALQHSNVKLTWDEDEPLRAKALRRKFNPDQLNEQDYRDYVASSSSDSESEPDEEHDECSGDDEEKATGEEKQKLRAKYLALLSDAGGAAADESKAGAKKGEKGNIEIKFHTGLDELSEKLTEKFRKTKNDETVWEAYLRKKREKKKARKNKSQGDESDFSDDDGDDGGVSSDGGVRTQDDPFFSHGDADPFDDPFFQGDGDGDGDGDGAPPREGKKGKKKDKKDSEGSTKIGAKFASSVQEKKKLKEEAALEKKEEEKRKAELELLLMDDDLVQSGHAAVAKSQTDEKKGKKKRKGGKEKAEGANEKLAAAANYEDPRFANLFTSHHYAIDPTDPHFKKSATHLSTIAEKQRQRLESGGVSKKEQEKAELERKEGDGGGGRKRKAEISSLVRSLKSKVEARK
ncbi:hypothetical protein AXG93_3911s1590 [Marchantia polymorpha subsp. ruderalis]|uniref:Uncharacterized protein n=1 Tax=Marchantia polymorpha subsp. ruderalis TaxID=1480154 RepID=A0A176W5J1_MARPO|nr:hypothetical protein AXG93_3911s1590 [Marchantia polymorpha subsp. ruderalis]